MNTIRIRPRSGLPFIRMTEILVYEADSGVRRYHDLLGTKLTARYSDGDIEEYSNGGHPWINNQSPSGSWTAIGGSSRPVGFVDITFEDIEQVVNSSHYNFHMYHGHAFVNYGVYIQVNDVIEFPLASAGGATITIPEPISTFETVPLKLFNLDLADADQMYAAGTKFRMSLQDDSSGVLSEESLTLNTNTGKYETTVSAQGLRLVSFVARFTVSGDASGNFNGTYTAVDTNFLEYRSQDSQRYFFNSLTQSWNFEGYGSSLDLNTSDAFNSSDSADSGIQFDPELPTVQEEISSTAQVSIQEVDSNNHIYSVEQQSDYKDGSQNISLDGSFGYGLQVDGVGENPPINLILNTAYTFDQTNTRTQITPQDGGPPVNQYTMYDSRFTWTPVTLGTYQYINTDNFSHQGVINVLASPPAPISAGTRIGVPAKVTTGLLDGLEISHRPSNQAYYRDKWTHTFRLKPTTTEMEISQMRMYYNGDGDVPNLYEVKIETSNRTFSYSYYIYGFQFQNHPITNSTSTIN